MNEEVKCNFEKIKSLYDIQNNENLTAYLNDIFLDLCLNNQNHKKKEETQSQIKEKNTAIENISSQKDELYSEIAVLDIEIEKVGAEIEESREEIDSLKEKKSLRNVW